MKKIDVIREKVLESVYEAGDRSAAAANPTHNMIEGTKVFIKAATDFLCSMVDTNQLEADNVDDEGLKKVAYVLAYRLCRMLAVAGGYYE